MSHEILVAPAAARDLKKLPPEHRERVRSAASTLAKDPRARAEKLVGEDAYRIRVGDYRIVFLVDDVERRVMIVRIRHRREAHRR